MSSTIVVSRRVGAFRTGTQIIYALFETGYESNVHPHHPNESCVAFGSIAQVMPWVMRAAAACVGGMLKRPGGYFTATGYLQLWLSELAHPRTMSDREIRLQASTSWRASIPTTEESWYEKNQLPFAVQQLKEHGYVSQAEHLQAGSEVRLKLHQDGDVLASLYGDVGSGGKIAPWRIIDHAGLALVDDSLAPNLDGSDANVHSPDLWEVGGVDRYDGQKYLALFVDGLQVSCSSGRSVLSDYIDKVAVELERHSPGSGVRAVRRLARRVDANHPLLPASTRVRLDIRDRLKNEWYQTQYDDVLQKVGVEAEVERGVLDVTIENLRRHQLVDLTHSLARGALQFTLPEQAKAGATIGDLFAA